MKKMGVSLILKQEARIVFGLSVLVETKIYLAFLEKIANAHNCS